MDPAIVRLLQEKTYEKRKQGALELEKTLRDSDKVPEILQQISKEFIRADTNNYKNGGLIALAACSISVGDLTLLAQIIQDVLYLLDDQDSRVRYYATESLYNIIKVHQELIPLYFNELFDNLLRVVQDSEQSVRNGGWLCADLILDYIHQQDKFPLTSFVPLLRTRIYASSTNARQFLIKFLRALDEIPNMELIGHLQHFLDGVLCMISDDLQASQLLDEFLREISFQSQSKQDYIEDGQSTYVMIPYAELVSILLPHITDRPLNLDKIDVVRKQPLINQNTQLVALGWINEFLRLEGNSLIQLVPKILLAILPCIDHPNKDIQEAATACDRKLLDLVISRNDKLDGALVVEVLTQLLKEPSQVTRIAALEWLITMHKYVKVNYSQLFANLLSLLKDPHHNVVVKALKLLSITAPQDSGAFDQFIKAVLNTFESDRKLLDQKGTLIIKTLCRYLTAEKVYLSMAHVLVEFQDSEFVSTLVQHLNMILMTSDELAELRLSLGQNPTFEVLFKCWVYDFVSLLSLCLISGSYQLACALIKEIVDIPSTLPLLVGLDKLVQMFESPVFTRLRVKLLEDEPHLQKCMFSILMLLPQSAAYNRLKARLNCVAYRSVTAALTSQDQSFMEHFRKVYAGVVQRQKSNSVLDRPVTVIEPKKMHRLMDRRGRNVSVHGASELSLSQTIRQALNPK